MPTINLSRPIIIFLSLTTVLISVNGCKRRATAPQEPAVAATSPAQQQQYHHPEGGTTPAGETRHFMGSIGSTGGLQMKLTREGERLTGNYFYQKIGTKIDLKGTIDKDGNVSLEEFDTSGKQTGIFKGMWRPDEDGLINIVGNWMKPGSDKKTAFSLHEEPIELSAGAEILAKQLKESNKKLKYDVEVQYPQLSGSMNPNAEKFNQEVKKMVTRKVSEFKKDVGDAETQESMTDEAMSSHISMSYTTALARDDLISVQFDIGSYSSGAAHPNSYSQVINFDLKNGKALRLGDLFKPGAKYLQAISAYCIKDLQKQSTTRGPDAMLDNDQIQSGAAPEAKNYQSWTITKKGLGINFDAYQVAPYAAGRQYVIVPYPALKELIKPDGPLAPFVK